MAKKLSKVIKGERITLKFNDVSFKKANEIFSVVDNNREHLSPWLSWVNVTKKPEDTFKFLFDCENKAKEGKGFTYGIYLENKYIGNINIFDIDLENKSGEIGYWLSLEYTRKGYMTEAVKTLEKEAFEKLELNRIRIRCDKNNKGSFGVALKCKYKLDGEMRQDSFNKETNAFRDTLVYSRLRKEFK